MDTLRKPVIVKSATDNGAAAPLTAAKGDDQLMSQAQQATTPGLDQVKARWKQQIGAAKLAWDKLTEDELQKLEGHAHRLASLIQERYLVTRDEADKQVKTFFEKHKL